MPYHALVTGSQASDAIPLDSGNCSPPSYDQRHVARPLDGDTDSARLPACDIGAYEVDKPPWANLLKNASFEHDANANSRPEKRTCNGTFIRSSAGSHRLLAPLSGSSMPLMIPALRCSRKSVCGRRILSCYRLGTDPSHERRLPLHLPSGLARQQWNGHWDCH